MSTTLKNKIKIYFMRWIKKGRLPGTELIIGKFGKEYRIPATAAYPNDVILEKGIVEVTNALTQEELSALLLNVLQKRENGLEAKQDTLESKMVELSDRINVLVDKVEEMQKKQGCPCYIFALFAFIYPVTLPCR